MFRHLNNHVYSPERLRPVIEQSAELRGLGRGAVDGLLSHIERRHQYLNDVIDLFDARPELSLVVDEDGEWRVIWPFGFFGYELQESTRLDGDWRPVDAEIATDGETTWTPIAPFRSRNFFRLTSP